MANIIDLRKSGGQLVLLGDALTLPSSNVAVSSATVPMISGSIRYNPDLNVLEYLLASASSWTTVAGNPNWHQIAATYTAANNDLLLANSAGAAFAITLPATPPVGATVRVKDGAGQCATNHVTLQRNGSTIMGAAADYVMNSAYQSADFVFSGTTWVVR